MKILHCCLANYYIDDFGYQENIITKMHKLQGHDVKILASTEVIKATKLAYTVPSSYISKDGIPITRIPYINWLPHFVAKKLRIYTSIRKNLERFKPDIIFLHNVQFIGVKEVVKYAKKSKVKIYADNHTDYMNSAKNWFSKNILHKIIYKWCVKHIEPYVIKFWGVTPSRRDFLVDFYKVNPNKVDLLVMGVDDSEIDLNSTETTRLQIRSKLNISDDQFVIITGGRITRQKNIHVLMDVINDLKAYNIKLIVFGKVRDDIKDEIEKFSDSSNILMLGWQSNLEINNLFFASDLAFFPSRHSVLWEQATGCGLPAVFRRYEGYTHLNVGGNCIFIDEVNKSLIKKTILSIYGNKGKYEEMKKIAVEKGTVEFSYSKIAQRAIEITE